MARENFMDKLKREREESSIQSPLNNTKIDDSASAVVKANPFRLNIKSNSKIIQTFDSDDDESNNSLNTVNNVTAAEPESVIKRKSKLFTENGKVIATNN